MSGRPSSSSSCGVSRPQKRFVASRQVSNVAPNSFALKSVARSMARAGSDISRIQRVWRERVISTQLIGNTFCTGLASHNFSTVESSGSFRIAPSGKDAASSPVLTPGVMSQGTLAPGRSRHRAHVRPHPLRPQVKWRHGALPCFRAPGFASSTFAHTFVLLGSVLGMGHGRLDVTPVHSVPTTRLLNTCGVSSGPGQDPLHPAVDRPRAGPRAPGGPSGLPSPTPVASASPAASAC